MTSPESLTIASRRKRSVSSLEIPNIESIRVADEDSFVLPPHDRALFEAASASDHPSFSPIAPLEKNRRRFDCEMVGDGNTATDAIGSTLTPKLEARHEMAPQKPSAAESTYSQQGEKNAIWYEMQQYLVSPPGTPADERSGRWGDVAPRQIYLAKSDSHSSSLPLSSPSPLRQSHTDSRVMIALPLLPHSFNSSMKEFNASMI